RLRPLDLPGAHAIRLDPQTVKAYQQLSKSLHDLPESFFTLPGMYSYYFWSERESPTTLSLTNWMYMLDDRQQERIIAQLESRPEIRVLSRPRLAKFWMKGGQLPSTPLVRYIDSHFTPDANVAGTEIWVRDTKLRL